MKIKITDINDSKIITFASKIGSAKGILLSDEKPQLNTKYDAEFDVVFNLEVDVNTHKTNTQEKSIDMHGSKISLKGVVESVDLDGMVYFRLSDDCLIMIESDGNICKGDWIEILLEPLDLSLSPF